MKVFMMAASMRKDSYNKKYIRVAASLLKTSVEKVNIHEFEEFNSPMYNGDIETSTGVPEDIKKLSNFISRSRSRVRG